MNNRLLGAALLACAACATPAATTKPEPTPVAEPAPKPDPALEARQKWSNPGGMWMPRQMVLPQHAEAFKAMGVALDSKALSSPLEAPLNAVVSLGGCTGSFVSAEGLVVTNHHCVQGALQLNSTPENNLVENGFLAKTKAEEKSAGPTARVMVEVAYRDATKEMTDGLEKIADPVARKKELESRLKTLIAGCEKDRPGIRCSVPGFFRGAEYQLVESLELRDVRLVYVPARSVGNYGGEIDNWAWPRHTGDWSFYRAYVGKDGKPADYSPDNVPFTPKHFLKVATAGVKPADFVMVVGYPGFTSRVTTYSEVKHDVDFDYPYRIQYLKERYALLEEIIKAGGPSGLKAGVQKQFIQNSLENSEGTLAGLTKGDLMERKKKVDEQVRAWAAQPGHEEYKAAIEKLDALLADEFKTAKADFDFGQTVGGSSLLRNALLFVRMAEERPKPDAERKPGFQDRDLRRLEGGQKAFARQFDQTIDRAAFKLALTRALALPEAERPWLATLLGFKKGQKLDAAGIDKALEKLYAGTKLVDEAVRLDLLTKGTTKQLQASKDPFIVAALAIWPTIKAKEVRDDKQAGESMLVSPKFAVAMREALGGLLAPDANGTLRITYGTIKPFKAGQASFTVVSEIPKKDKGAQPYDAPKKELELIAQKKFGPWTDAALGEVPVDYLADLDITGGNSGSPTLNDKGELVGLAFDGTIEGVASDVVFDGATTRSIHVDARYMAWVMDGVDGADELLKELGLTPAL